MQGYDAALKKVLMKATGPALVSLTGFAIERRHNVELPKADMLRVDLLGETGDGTLVHIELQSGNHPEMALRMAEYAFPIYRQFERWPAQLVLYAGRGAARMATAIESECFSYRYKLVDIRELDGAPLLDSEELGDNLPAILMRLSDERAAVRTILRRIVKSAPGVRSEALEALAVLAGLRRFGDIMREETEKMPILEDMMDHDLFGPAIRQGLEQGRAEGARNLVVGQIRQRFGQVPEWAQQQLDAAGSAELESIGLRLFGASRLDVLPAN